MKNTLALPTPKDAAGSNPAAAAGVFAFDGGPMMDVKLALQPFLPCDLEEAEPEDWISAARVLVREITALNRDYAPEITPIVREIGLDSINARKPVPYEAVIEILEYTSDYIAIEDAEVGMWLRSIAERELVQRFGREHAAMLLRRYVDPAPPGEPPYGEDGIMKDVDLSEQANVRWLVQDMIPAGTVGMWVAPFSSGKTFGSVALGLALAFGRDWMDKETVGGGHVRYIAAEGLASFDRRLAGWLVRHDELAANFTRKGLAETLAGRFSLSDGRLRLDDPRLEEVLITTIRRDGTRLLVLDTLGRLLGIGQSDEDNSVANSVMGVLHRVAAITGCTILLVHHPGHTQTYRARGASAWQQAADWVLVSKGDLRAGDPVRLINTKQRDAELFDDMAYHLRPVPISCDGEPWSGAVFEPVSVSLTTSVSLGQRIRLCVQANPGASLRQVRALVKGDSGEIGSEIIRLVDSGRLINKGSGSRYSLHDNPAEWPGDAAEEFANPVDLSDLTEA